jgi:hypothetical protein
MLIAGPEFTDPGSTGCRPRPTLPHNRDHSRVQVESHAHTPSVPPPDSPPRPVLDLRPRTPRARPRRPRSRCPAPTNLGDHTPYPRLPPRPGRPCHVHRTRPSVPQDASLDIQGVSPLIQDVPATGQNPVLYERGTRLLHAHDRPSRSDRLDLPDVKSAICKTKTRSVRARDRPCRRDQPRSYRRATSIPRRTDSPCPTARSALHQTRTSITSPITPRIQAMGPALCNPGSVLSARGSVLYARRDALCTRRDVFWSGETLPRPERRSRAGPNEIDHAKSGHEIDESEKAAHQSPAATMDTRGFARRCESTSRGGRTIGATFAVDGMATPRSTAQAACT